ERNVHPLPEMQSRLELGRNAIREGARNREVGDDVREQGGPASGACRRPAPDQVILPPHELQVVEGLAPVLGARMPQEKRRMEGRHHQGAPQAMELASETADGLSRPQELLRGKRAEGADHPGLYGGELSGEVRRTRRNLLRLGVPVTGRPTLYDVADVDFL